jgi:membrane-associated protease RseP (regulator of RpoE activity)
MKTNVGSAERRLRIAVGLVLVLLAIVGIGAPWTWIGLVPLVTGLFSFCPVYALLGRSIGQSKQP